MAISTVLLPVGYVGGLLAVLIAVGRSLKAKNRTSPFDDSGYFPINRAKLEYEELAEQYSPDDMNGKRVLTIALMHRAVEGVTRAMRLREEKPPLQQMVREGIVGESLWDKLVEAEAALEEEFQDLLEECNLYKPNWSNSFLQEASQIAQMKMQQEAKANGTHEHEHGENCNHDHDHSHGEPHGESPITDAEREKLAQELIEEEERARRKSKTKNKKK